MAAAHIPSILVFPFQEAEPAGTSWWAQLGNGVTDFFTVERARDTLIVLIAAGLYYLLSRHARDRMILTPSRIVVAQGLRAQARLGVQHPDLDPLVSSLETATRNPVKQEELILRGLALRRDLAADARTRQLAGLNDDALLSAAQSVKGSLHPPVAGYLTKETLSSDQRDALRTALATVDREKAETSWLDNRMTLRRNRKSQSLGVAGLLLIVLLVIMFGNPAVIAFGVLGAMISRLIAFFRDSTDTDQKYNWVILYLVPIVGGLSAYGGVLLIDAMRTWGVLGDTFAGVDFGGEHANAPTMAAAFLFGFVERLLDNVVDKAAPDGMAAVSAQAAKESKTGAESATETSRETTTVTTELPATDPPPGGSGPSAAPEPPDSTVAAEDSVPPGDGGAAPSSAPAATGPVGPGAPAAGAAPSPLIATFFDLADQFFTTPFAVPPPPPPPASPPAPQPTDPGDPSQQSPADYDAGVRAAAFVRGFLDQLTPPDRGK